MIGNMVARTSGDDQPQKEYATVVEEQPLRAEEHTAMEHSASSHATLQIIQIWSDRLQLISLLATFFTSIDGLLLGLAVPIREKDHTGRAANAALSGALIFHAAAAILSFVASFVLIRYRLNDARHKPVPPLLSAQHAQFQSDPIPGHSIPRHAKSPSAAETATAYTGTATTRSEKPPEQYRSFSYASVPLIPPSLSAHFPGIGGSNPTSPTAMANDILSLFHSMSDNIAVSRVHPWDQLRHGRDNGSTEAHAPSLTRLLTRCHNTCAAFVTLGFLLNIIGFVTFCVGGARPRCPEAIPEGIEHLDLDFDDMLPDP
ncbi:hypothetical protein EVG20_g854 [Dentipellis fragilis]|uniref:Uncharacterized protein n=1 Tax=Dentipellis fragilis TaxID=205917 RepID=A0A4Y9ZE71_9AGAM|nr:hypothetical protein EVG20_g854 [Dentipellis fragilis]